MFLQEHLSGVCGGMVISPARTDQKQQRNESYAPSFEHECTIRKLPNSTPEIEIADLEITAWEKQLRFPRPYMSGGHLPLTPLALYTKILPSYGRYS